MDQGSRVVGNALLGSPVSQRPRGKCLVVVLLLIQGNTPAAHAHQMPAPVQGAQIIADGALRDARQPGQIGDANTGLFPQEIHDALPSLKCGQSLVFLKTAIWVSETVTASDTQIV